MLQNHHHTISSQSLENFWRHWLEKTNSKTKQRANKETTDTLLTGSNTLQDNIIQDVHIRKTSRYRWGAAGVAVVAGEEEEDQTQINP